MWLHGVWTKGLHVASNAAAAKSLQPCPNLCDLIDSSPPGSPPDPGPWDSPGKNTGGGCHFLLQCMKVKSESEVAQCVGLFTTPWTAAYQAPPSMGFSRQKYWSGVPLPSPVASNMWRQIWYLRCENKCFLSDLQLVCTNSFRILHVSFQIIA